MTEGLRTIIYPVKDIAQAKMLYGEFLGVKPDPDMDAISTWVWIPMATVKG